MLFNSYIFIFVFLPLCLAGYYLLNHFKKYTAAKGFLCVMSLWFYGYFNSYYLLIITASILINFLIYLALWDRKEQTKRKILLYAAMLFNLGLLFYFKYYDFFIANMNGVFHTDFVLKNIVLPLGISFFTFQQISFILDAYHDRAAQERYRFLDYAVYVTFFPQLIAGPIVTHDELIPQFLDTKKKVFCWEDFSAGIYAFILGLGKKVLIADNLGNAVNWGYDNLDVLAAQDAVIVMLAYTFQIYFDFSGYCDMAMGIAKMFRITLPLNFNSPYKACTITDFWKRWHMTLTRFFTKYLYIPLGGNRGGTVKTCRNIFLVYLVSGLWHGANWTFVLWGVLHGSFCILTRLGRNVVSRIPKAVNWVITFVFLNITWAVFRAESVAESWMLIEKILHPDFGSLQINSALYDFFRPLEIKFLINGLGACGIQIPSAMWVQYLWILVIIGAVLWGVLRTRNVWEKTERFQPTWKTAILLSVVLSWSVMSFSGLSTFLYFNF